jgi:hypothetical protein
MILKEFKSVKFKASTYIKNILKSID